MSGERVLVTGAGGPAAVAIMRSIGTHVALIAADIDPVAVGLYLAPAPDRVLLPRGDDPSFVSALLSAAIDHGADLVIPTVDTELLVVAEARARFAEHRINLLVESPDTLRICLDKMELVRVAAGVIPVPRTILWLPDTTDSDVEDLGLPFIVKPRRGSGGRGVAVLGEQQALQAYPRDGHWLAQEFLPGQEYSIDVLARPDGHIVAAVPRSRDKVDSGIAVAGRTVADPVLVEMGAAVARAVGATTVVNVQVRRAVDGTPKLLEINPRFPGAMPLTIAAGVDMPMLALDAALERPLPDDISFVEVSVVRHWAEIVVPIAEYGVVDIVPTLGSTSVGVAGGGAS